MIVYRFEKNGLGPYVSGSGVIANGSFYRKEGKTRTQKKYGRLFDQIVSNIDTQRRFEAWDKAHQSDMYMYGCPSKEALRAYFGGDFKALFKQGFRIKRYKVPEEEIIDIGVEVAFPVKYHKLQKISKIYKAKNPI